jgi:deoxyribodipyrimidine photo-lyase
MQTAIYWFRNDLRLTDNPALNDACARARKLALLHVVPLGERHPTRWGFERSGPHRRYFRDQALAGLAAALAGQDQDLLIAAGDPVETVTRLAQEIGADDVFCEAISAPEELAECAALRAAGLNVHERWQSSLLEPTQLPFAISDMPRVFTAFRRSVESTPCHPPVPRAAPARIAPPARLSPMARASFALRIGVDPAPPLPAGASFPFTQPEFQGSERAALSHIERYFQSTAPRHYKETRNGLCGVDYSTKFSPWLALGAVSARTVYSALREHESRCGANDSTYWIRFELLWRDFFRFATLQHGVRLFRAGGLSSQPPPNHHADAFRRWCGGNTGHALVDAGMCELAATGYLSNRLRQVVASYLIHELDCDWRAGAAWFESRLVDFDVYSNQGNWLYLAGRGADPRQGRRFNPDKQAATYDPDGRYRSLWRQKLA